MENKIQPLTEIKVILFSLQKHALHVLVHPNAATGLVNFPSQNIKPDLSLEESAIYCLKNFLQADEIYLEQLYTYGDEYLEEKQRLISIVYYA